MLKEEFLFCIVAVGTFGSNVVGGKKANLQQHLQGSKLQKVQKYPNEILVLGMMFALLALVCLTALKVTYIIVFRQWSTEIFAGIMSMITFILGAIFGAKT